MTNQTDTNHLARIALRIREMRQILGYTAEQMAQMISKSFHCYAIRLSRHSDKYFSVL